MVREGIRNFWGLVPRMINVLQGAFSHEIDSKADAHRRELLGDVRAGANGMPLRVRWLCLSTE